MSERQPYTNDLRQQTRNMTGRYQKRDRNNGPRRDDDYGVRRIAPDAVPTNWPHVWSSEYMLQNISSMDATTVEQYMSVPAGSFSGVVSTNNRDGIGEQNA